MPKTVAIFTSGEGHKSIAEAVQEKLQNDFQVKTFYEDIPLAKVYGAFYKFFPHLSQYPFKALSNKKAVESINKVARLKYQKQIDNFFAKHKPDILINTYAFYTPCLERLQKLTQKPFINIITDPKTTHPLVISPNAKVNLTFDKNSNKLYQRYYPQAKYQSAGWFVRNRFEENYDQVNVRKKLGLDPNILTFLIASGSEGTNLILKVLPSLILSSHPIQVVVACGNNNTLFKSILALNSFLDKSGNHNKLIPLKFTPDIHQYMQAADLVIGKAGPNMLFESVATQTPFFAITHISGQEDGNLDIINDLKLGYVEENLLKAQKLLKKILNKPDQLKKFHKNIIRLKKQNQSSKEELLRIINDLI